jgi:signal transduction histidine kinase
MKPESARFAQRYTSALRKHLKQGSRARAQSALRIGRDALASGLGMLELARIHEQALTALEPASRKPRIIRRAENFFTTAGTAIIETHYWEPAHKIALNRLEDMTNRRAAELETTKRELQRGIIRCEAEANSCQKNGKHQNKCLEKALKLQKRLRHGSHRVLAALEDERKKISRELQDEIAQTLLGINVRLHSLREQARSDPKGLQNEIASTRRLVVKSARSVQRFARKLDKRQEGQSNRPDTAP